MHRKEQAAQPMKVLKKKKEKGPMSDLHFFGFWSTRPLDIPWKATKRDLYKGNALMLEVFPIECDSGKAEEPLLLLALLRIGICA